VFLGLGTTSCQVAEILTPNPQRPGTYKVVLSREADNFYRMNNGMYLRTTMCLNLALSATAYVDVSVGGMVGTVTIAGPMPTTCRIEGIYSRAQ
jgi:hypothetical protein